MKRFTLLACVSLTAVTLSSQMAAAEDFKPYVSLFGGASLLNPVNTVTPGNTPYSVKTNTGYLIGGAVGLKWNDMLRTELELSHGSNNANSYNIKGGAFNPASGLISATYLLGNVWLDIPTQTAFTPYIGGGLGVGWATADVSYNGNISGYGSNASGGALAYQVGAGVKYNVSQNIDLDIGYRFKGLGKTNFNDRDGTGFYNQATLNSHNIQVGLTFSF
jgi:opacity protein-like surface antigen